MKADVRYEWIPAGSESHSPGNKPFAPRLFCHCAFNSRKHLCCSPWSMWSRFYRVYPYYTVHVPR